VFLERFQTLKQQREVNDRIQKLGSYGLEAAEAKDWPQAVRNFEERSSCAVYAPTPKISTAIWD